MKVGKVVGTYGFYIPIYEHVWFGSRYPNSTELCTGPRPCQAKTDVRIFTRIITGVLKHKYWLGKYILR